jgi:hypothetical protein
MSKIQKLPRGPLLLIVMLAVLATSAFGVLYGQFSYSELCPVCARARESVDWQIPFTRHTYYSDREERETPLHRALVKSGLVEDHERPAVFGTGQPIVWSLHSPHAGEFLETMLHWTDADTTLMWLNRMRDPRYSRLCQYMAASSQGMTFSNRDDWENWLQEFTEDHDQMIDRSAGTP